jgi:hypothetical protein
MDANRGCIFLSSNYQVPVCWEADLKLFTKAALTAARNSDGCTAKGEGENYSAPICERKGFKTLFTVVNIKTA